MRSSRRRRLGEPLERGVGRDLEGLGRAGVLGVFEHLLLAAGAAQKVERRLAEREHLAGRLDRADDHHQRVGALVQLLQSARDALGVVARLVEVRLEAGAVAAARRHRDLRLQHADEGVLGGVRLVEVLDDLLLALVDWLTGPSSNLGLKRGMNAAGGPAAW